VVLPSATLSDLNSDSKQCFQWWESLPRVDCEVAPLTDNGEVADWEGMHAMLEYLLDHQLHIKATENSILFAEPVTTKKETRAKMVELFFEEFGFLSFFSQKAPVLASYMCAKDNVVIVDIGGKYTSVVPVVEGFISQRGLVRANFGGENLTQ
jgi:actin-related protein